MALQQVLCAGVLVITLLCQGCHSQLDVCARATGINGGEDETPGNWPWSVTIDVGKIWLCGGSLINNQWVVTQGDCVWRSLVASTEVTLGLNNRAGSNAHQVKRGLDAIIPYPKYPSIALLKLSAPVNFTDYIQPVCLAAANSTFHNGTSSWMIGFPKSDFGSPPATLQEQKVPVIGQNECNCSHLFTITEDFICGAFRPGGICVDKGGPVVTKKDDLWIQIAVGFDTGSCHYYTPYTNIRLSEYQDWINNTVTGPKPGFVTFISPGINGDLSFQCSKTPPTTAVTTTKDDDSIFGGGTNLFHFAHIRSLCIVSLTLLVLLGSSAM
ncbi:tryptase-like [Parambassis ranga]|uniref:Tryptase-like n=1 Tax=Parambassis ranga TaxID=210632 RepID=A0A6P7I0P0_9TELE|nr:tryptase-like [Parambassis ranga]